MRENNNEKETVAAIGVDQKRFKTRTTTLTLPKYTSCLSNRLPDSVFPAPLSPLITMDWLAFSWSINWYAESAIANMCGGHAALIWLQYFFCSWLWIDRWNRVGWKYVNQVRDKKYLSKRVHYAVRNRNEFLLRVLRFQIRTFRPNSVNVVCLLFFRDRTCSP